jgi:hypothetical protein
MNVTDPLMKKQLSDQITMLQMRVDAAKSPMPQMRVDAAKSSMPQAR